MRKKAFQTRAAAIGRPSYVFAVRRSYASAVLGVVILSVRLSVCPSVCLSHACFVTNPQNLPAIFLTIRKGNPSSFLPPTVVGGRCPLPPEMGDRSDPLPFKNRSRRQISVLLRFSEEWKKDRR